MLLQTLVYIQLKNYIVIMIGIVSKTIIMLKIKKLRFDNDYIINRQI